MQLPVLRCTLYGIYPLIFTGAADGIYQIVCSNASHLPQRRLAHRVMTAEAGAN